MLAHAAEPETSQAPLVDPGVTLGAVAAQTSRITIGPLVTALARRRPWKVARETATLDLLSGGRTMFGVGLGAADEFARFGEGDDPRSRAEKLNEGLDLLGQMWQCRPVDFAGRHISVVDTTFPPKPVQQPSIPVRVAGLWPNWRPAVRAARWDGIFPLSLEYQALAPQEYRKIKAFITENREAPGPFDIVLDARDGSPTLTTENVNAYSAAGVTWWLHELLPTSSIEETVSSFDGPSSAGALTGCRDVEEETTYRIWS